MRGGGKVAWMAAGAGIAALMLWGVARRGGDATEHAGESLAAPRVPRQPRRIVSLAPSLTETLFAVGLGECVVGVTRYCSYPPEVASRAKVGGCYDPNYEAILALDPELVVMLAEHTEPARYLRQRGRAVLAVDQHTVAAILASIETIGGLGDAATRERADRLVDGIRTRLEAIRAVTADASRPRVLISVERELGAGGIRDIYVAGSGGFYGELLACAGGRNAYGGALLYPRVSGEGIIRMNPDVIIDMAPDLDKRHLDVADVARDWQALPEVAAVRTGRVHVVSDDAAVISGPRFVKILEKLVGIIHPELQLP